ncbi:MAG: hypothetical protein R3F19_09295 [Verrucomicrobiales bacterium]
MSVNSNTRAEEGSQFPAKWNAVLDHDFDGASLAAVLADYGQQLKGGTFITEFAKVLERERRMNLPMEILLSAMTAVPQTVRVDGIMPFNIPEPVNITEPVQKLLDEVTVMNYDVPDSGRKLVRLRDEISVCILAYLHRREMQIDHRLAMRLQLECPYSPNVGRKESLMLMGYLPFGGRVTVFYSSLIASDWLGRGLDNAGLEYEEYLGVERNGESLQIVSSERNRPKASIDRFKIF